MCGCGAIQLRPKSLKSRQNVSCVEFVTFFFLWCCFFFGRVGCGLFFVVLVVFDVNFCLVWLLCSLFCGVCRTTFET